MLDYEFKTCISGGREHYGTMEKELEESLVSMRSEAFPDSLISFLYLDMEELKPLFRQIIQGVRRVIQEKDRAVSDEVYALFCQLADRHVYFDLLRLDWRYRLDRAWYTGYEFPANFLQVGILEELPHNLTYLQQKALDLIAHVLDMDGEDSPVEEKMTAYYLAAERERREVFPFRPQRMSYELLYRETFSEVLCPDTVYDLVDFHLRECVKREIKMRSCKNCGRYFAVTGHQGTEYCSRVANSRGQTCKEIGAAHVWERTRGRDEVFREYRREYKTRFARMRRGGLDPQEVYDWGARAREKKAECDAGKLTLEEFSEWLKNS